MLHVDIDKLLVDITRLHFVCENTCIKIYLHVDIDVFHIVDITIEYRASYCCIFTFYFDAEGLLSMTGWISIKRIIFFFESCVCFLFDKEIYDKNQGCQIFRNIFKLLEI